MERPTCIDAESLRVNGEELVEEGVFFRLAVDEADQVCFFHFLDQTNQFIQVIRISSMYGCGVDNGICLANGLVLRGLTRFLDYVDWIFSWLVIDVCRLFDPVPCLLFGKLLGSTKLIQKHGGRHSEGDDG